MAGFLMVLVAVGFLGFVASIILLAVSFIRKKPKKPKIIGAVACFMLVIVASIAYPDSELEDYRSRQEEKELLEEQGRALKEEESEISRQNDVEMLLNQLRQELPGNVGQGEKFESVELNARGLIISVDISGNQSPLSDIDIADSRTASLTDEVLRLDALDEYWDSVTVSFANMGYITFTKSDIVIGEYGRYFNIPSNFKLTGAISGISPEQQEQFDIFVEMIEMVYNNESRTMEDCADVMNQRNRVSPLIRDSISDDALEKYEFISSEYFRLRDEELEETETYVVLSQTGEKYHRQNCRTLTYTGTPVTVQEAKNQGYEACGVCHPRILDLRNL